jgi:hypothetical protein
MWVENKNAPKPLLYLGGHGVNIMAGKLPGLELSKADYVAPRLKQRLVLKRAKREQNGLRLCVDFEH